MRLLCHGHDIVMRGHSFIISWVRYSNTWPHILFFHPCHQRCSVVFEHIMLDFLKLTPSKGKKHYVIIVNVWLKWVKAFPNSAQTAVAVSKALLRLFHGQESQKDFKQQWHTICKQSRWSTWKISGQRHQEALCLQPSKQTCKMLCWHRSSLEKPFLHLHICNKQQTHWQRYDSHPIELFFCVIYLNKLTFLVKSIPVFPLVIAFWEKSRDSLSKCLSSCRWLLKKPCGSMQATANGFQPPNQTEAQHEDRPGWEVDESDVPSHHPTL